jgi:hypothetical protein
MCTKWLGVVLCALSAGSGCAGATYSVVLPTARYPVSLSRVLPDEEGRPLAVGEGLVSLGVFDLDSASVGILYALTGTTIDLSRQLNAQVERLCGEGIVELSLWPENSGFNALFPLTLLPVFPGSSGLHVSGRVVRRPPIPEDPRCHPPVPPRREESGPNALL